MEVEFGEIALIKELIDIEEEFKNSKLFLWVDLFVDGEGNFNLISKCGSIYEYHYDLGFLI